MVYVIAAHVHLNGFMTYCRYCSGCNQTTVSTLGQIIPLSGYVLPHYHSNKLDYCIKHYANKRVIKAKSITFGF